MDTYWPNEQGTPYWHDFDRDALLALVARRTRQAARLMAQVDALTKERDALLLLEQDRVDYLEGSEWDDDHGQGGADELHPECVRFGYVQNGRCCGH